MKTKTEMIRRAIEEGQDSKALTIASRLARLGEQRDDIMRAKSAKLSPSLYEQMGYNVPSVIDQGLQAVRQRFQK
jgi:hypothetical protein